MTKNIDFLSTKNYTIIIEKKGILIFMTKNKGFLKYKKI